MVRSTGGVPTVRVSRARRAAKNGEAHLYKSAMTITRSGGVVFTGINEPATHEKVSVDGGAVHIDADDSEHVLRIRHVKDDGVDILCAIDNVTNSTTARIDSAGVAHVTNVITPSVNLTISSRPSRGW